MPLALGLLIATLGIIYAFAIVAKPKALVLPRDWKAKPAQERLEYLFHEAGRRQYQGQYGPATTTYTFIHASAEELKFGWEQEEFKKGSKTHVVHTKRELVLPLKQVNQHWVNTFEASDAFWVRKPYLFLTIGLNTDRREDLIKWTGTDLLTGGPSESSPEGAVYFRFATEKATLEAREAILELVQNAQGIAK